MEQVRTTIRLPAKLLKSIDYIRKDGDSTTLSDFIRHALEHYVQETRRKQLEAECTRLALEEDLSALAEVDFPEHVARMVKAEKGEF